ncbi:proline--tRNA ligase [Helicobacter sp. 16-1353]|uniref:proline--tRNA ligase n=1 Tax=Helicobacter sp. 16-1353 TaxID=2004996 RepID=UPI000DCE4B2B|nr:proline--tRNA ligase [Helicobacter sp. 16-1353]RAX53011.1 proline--tRNA ligase [Helicobacter sp. 16-1353]
MRFSKLFAITSKEEPKDCVLKSHKYLIRGGFIKQIGSGIYNFLPLGKIILNKVIKIIKEEMDKSGANELSLGFVTPAELWIKSQRYDKYGKELLKFKDRKENPFVLGPTHEEAIVECVKGEVKSYKQLPLNLYQINLKFRDEIRPRFGLMRGREFLMKDAYSFHANKEDLDREFELMEATYKSIFRRLGVDFRVVEADSGAIGGSGSKEFMLLAPSGEDSIVICQKCEYAANIEIATRAFKRVDSPAPKAEFAKFHTPNVSNIKDLSEFFKVDSYYLLKCVAKKAVFASGESAKLCGTSVDSNKSADSTDSAKLGDSTDSATITNNSTHEICFFFLRGCDELSHTKALNAIPNAIDLIDLDSSELEAIGLPAGFIGAYGLRNITNAKYIFFDRELEDSADLICGANERDYHFVGVDLSKFQGLEYRDLLEVKEGDLCPKCGGTLGLTKGIEIGHIFKLGDRYSRALEASFLDKDGKAKLFEMGCYGIGVSRILPAILEQKADESGAVWGDLAPFEVDIVISNIKNEAEVEFANNLYENLKKCGIEVIIDDRDVRFGSKMADFELIGFKNAIIVGKALNNGKIELVRRKTLEKLQLDSNIPLQDLLELVRL